MTVRIVAECGANHGGSVNTAVRMIDVLGGYCTEMFEYRAVAPVVKFQKRNPRESLTESEYNAPHPNLHNSFGKTYGEHRETLELDLADHSGLQLRCRVLGVQYACSVWDLTSAQEIMRLYPEYIKVPSACNLDFQLIGKLCSAYEGDIHISLGMTAKDEIERIVSFVERLGRSKDTVLYACTSGYPVDAQDVCLREITRLQEVYGHRVKGFGFSGHHNGIAIDMAAVALGVEWIERHFTLNRTWKGTDHAASLEPEGMRKLIRDVGQVGKSLTEKPDILDVERVQREKLKRQPTDRVIPKEVKVQELVA